MCVEDFWEAGWKRADSARRYTLSFYTGQIFTMKTKTKISLWLIKKIRFHVSESIVWVIRAGLTGFSWVSLHSRLWIRFRAASIQAARKTSVSVAGMGAPRSLWKIAVTLMLQLRAHKVISTHWAQDNKEGYYSPLTVNHSKEVEVKKKKIVCANSNSYHTFLCLYLLCTKTQSNNWSSSSLCGSCDLGSTRLT